MKKFISLLAILWVVFSCNLKDYTSHYNPIINKVTGFENVSADSGYKLGITYPFPIAISPVSWTNAIEQYIKEKTNVIIEIDNGFGDTANNGVVVILKNGKALKYNTQYTGYYDDSKNAYDSTAYSFRVINHFPENNHFSYRILLQNAMDGNIFYTSETRKIYLYPTPLQFVLLPIYDTTTMFVAVNNGISDTSQDFILYSNYPIQDFEYNIELQGAYSGIIDLGFSNDNKNKGKALATSIVNKTNNPIYKKYPYVCFFKVIYKTYAQYLGNDLKMIISLSGLKAVTNISNIISKAMPLKVVHPYFEIGFQDKNKDLGDSIYHYAVVPYNVGLLPTKFLTDTINKLLIRYSFNNPVYADSFNLYFPDDDINGIGWRVGEPRVFRTLQDFLDRVNFIYTKRGNDPVMIKFDVNCNLVQNNNHDTAVYYTFKSIVPEPQINIKLVPTGTTPNNYTKNGFISKNGSLSVFNLFDLTNTNLQYTKDNGLSIGIANDNSMLQYELSWQIDDNDIINDENIYNYEYVDYYNNKVGINISPLNSSTILLDANKPLNLFLNINSNLILKNLNYGTNIFMNNKPIHLQWILRRKYDGKIWRGKESFYFQNAHIPVSNMFFIKNIAPRIFSDSLLIINTNFYDINAYLDDINNINYVVGGSYIMQSTDGNFVVPNPNNGLFKSLKNVFLYRLEISYNANKVLCNIGLNAGNTSEFSKYFNSDYYHYKIWLTADASSSYFKDNSVPKIMNISIAPYSNYLPVTMVSGTMIPVPIYATNLVNGGDGNVSKVIDISMAVGNNKLYNGVDFFGSLNTLPLINNDVWSLNKVVLHIGKFADNGSGNYSIYVNEKTINLGNIPVQFVNPN